MIDVHVYRTEFSDHMPMHVRTCRTYPVCAIYLFFYSKQFALRYIKEKCVTVIIDIHLWFV